VFYPSDLPQRAELAYASLSELRRPGVVTLLRSHRIALVVADTAGKWPPAEDVTAFVYLRLHGDKKIYVSGYTPVRSGGC
jgi:uncharacterized protein YecE (DUF72 family)